MESSKKCPDYPEIYAIISEVYISLKEFIRADQYLNQAQRVVDLDGDTLFEIIAEDIRIN